MLGRGNYAPTQEEAALLMKNKAELDTWYAEVPWRPGFIEKGSSPMVTTNAVWTVVDEVFDRKVRIPKDDWDAIQRASRFLGKMLRHGENDRWSPTRDSEQSICIELAYNAAISRKILADACVPSDDKATMDGQGSWTIPPSIKGRQLRGELRPGEEEIHHRHGPPRRQNDAPHQNGARAQWRHEGAD